VHALIRRADRAPRARRLGAAIRCGDVLSLGSLRQAMAEVDAVVHCAGLVSRSPRDKEAVVRTNIEGSNNVFSLALERGIRVVHTSSIACVGPSTDPRPLEETDPPSPLGFPFPYVESKRQAEALALYYAKQGLDVVVLSPGSVMGPGDPNFGSTDLPRSYLLGRLRTFAGGGMSFCDVRDVADAYVVALERSKPAERYILAGINRSYKQVQEQLRQITGLHWSWPIPPGLGEWAALCCQLGSLHFRHSFENLNQAVVRWGHLFHYCSSAKAQRELDYRSRDFAETLSDTVADHVLRGVAAATTPELRALVKRATAHAF
jgi:dihydroflavonol-4-reductase